MFFAFRSPNTHATKPVSEIFLARLEWLWIFIAKNLTGSSRSTYIVISDPVSYTHLTQGYVLETTLKPYQDLDWKILTALNNNTEPKFNISLAFRELAENAAKIGNLNISPYLLDNLLNDKNDRK